MSTDKGHRSIVSIQTAKAALSAAGSLAAAIVVFRSITAELLPDELRGHLSYYARSVLGWFSSELTLVIEEFDGIESNHIFDAATLYLGNKTKTNSDPRRLKISRSEAQPAVTVTVDRNEPISDYYDGVRYTWTLICRRSESPNPRDMNSTLKSEVKYLEVSFHRKHKETALNRYISHIIEEAKMMKADQKLIKLHTVRGGWPLGWSGLNLNHPATFETITMDPKEKERIIEDLERFVRRKEYYQRVGKAWKRGYLLYGPPGTGKSSLIAAMANHLKFDVYDLELGALQDNSNLRTLLLATENRSILVVEDIDCSVQLKNREDDLSSPPPASNNHLPENKVTLSGFLNFIDGLWSSCGDERIIIFTTNYKDKLDPALLRPGRMDVHIHMSYCTPGAFRILARNYLGIESHELFQEITELIEQVQVTPAEVAEQLMKEDEPRVALQGLIGFLREKEVGRDRGRNDKSLGVLDSLMT